MSSRLITKVPNRPNFYFFDTALKNVKFCLFTKDLDKEGILVNSKKWSKFIKSMCFILLTPPQT